MFANIVKQNTLLGCAVVHVDAEQLTDAQYNVLVQLAANKNLLVCDACPSFEFASNTQTLEQLQTTINNALQAA